MNDRELDALVAEKVMGWEWVKDNPARGPSHYREQRFIERAGFAESHPSFIVPAIGSEPVASWNEPPHYSTKIEGAWMVVEKLSGGRSENFSIHRTGDRWSARFRDIESPDKPDFSEADTAPKAICLAALKAVGEKREEE